MNDHTHNDLRDAVHALRQFAADVTTAMDNGQPPTPMADDVLDRRTNRLFRIAAEVAPACGCALSVELKLAGTAGQHINRVLTGGHRVAPANRADLITARAHLSKMVELLTLTLDDDETWAAS